MNPTNDHVIYDTQFGSNWNAPVEQMNVGLKRYEISNHLGNVLATITDRPVGVDSITTNESVEYSEPSLASASDYYPFGMLMPGRNIKSQVYPFGFTSLEKDDEIKGVGNSYTTAFREYDPRIVMWWSVDPLFRNYPSHSPYNYTEGNPIMFTDRTGKGKNSTHTDEKGKVIAVKDDGDLGVYKHSGTDTEAKKKFEQNYSSTNTSAGGTKMGETVTPLGFADFGAYEKDGTVKPGLGAQIDFNSNWATNQVDGILNQDPNVAEYAWKARGGKDWDVKNNAVNEGKSIYYGSKLYGKYASARDAGNFAAGAVAQISIVPNLVLDYGFGTYNMSGNNVGKSFLMIASDALIFDSSPVIGAGIIYYKAKFGEDKLTRMGIEAGKNIIKNK